MSAAPTPPSPEPRPGVRGSYAKGTARRDAIVEVATEFFGRMGFRGATMLQIAAACGISRAGLLHHFPTKESLLEAVLAHRDEVDGRRATHDSDESGLDALADLVRLAERNARIPAIVHLFAVLSAEAGDPDHPAHDYFVRRYEVARDGVRSALERARTAGLLAPGVEPEALAVETVALMDGLQVQWLLDPTRVDMPGLLRARLRSALVVPLPD